MTDGPKIRALIVDDEPVAREGIRILLRDDAEIEIAGECADGTSAVAAIRDLAPDLVFLDVQMPELDGFGVIGRIGAANMPATIFVTAYDKYALRAFEVAALDYLLKPFDDERFAVALDRAKSQIRQGAVHELSRKLVALLEQQDELVPSRSRQSGEYLRRVMLKSGGRVTFLSVEEIDWIEAEGDYVRIHAAGKRHLLRETMKGLEQQLDPALFVRTHRSTIVNLDRVKELHPYFHGDYMVILEDGTELKLSRGRREAFSRALGRPL